MGTVGQEGGMRNASWWNPILLGRVGGEEVVGAGGEREGKVCHRDEDVWRQWGNFKVVVYRPRKVVARLGLWPSHLNLIRLSAQLKFWQIQLCVKI